MTDQLSDIEQEMMFKRNERKAIPIIIGCLIIELGIAAYFLFKFSLYPIMFAPYLINQFALIPFIRRKYPFRKEHLKQ